MVNNFICAFVQELQFISHWLHSMAAQAPEGPVLLVGTHKDQLEDLDADLEEAQAILTDFLSRKPAMKANIEQSTDKTGKKRWFFGVDNKSRETIDGKERCSDVVISQIRSVLEQKAKNDKRTIKGLYIC